MSDIRKWFMKQHDKNNSSASKPAKPTTPEKPSVAASQVKTVQPDQEAGRRKTSKYFATEKQKPKDDKDVEEVPAKRKAPKGRDESSSDVKPPPVKKHHKVEDEDDEDFVPDSREVEATPNKKLKSSSGRGVTQKLVVSEDINDDKTDVKIANSNVKSAGRGRGGRGASKAQAVGKTEDDDESDEDKDNEKSASKSAGRGRGGRGASTGGGGRGRGGGGRGGFMNFGERKDPPHKGEKEVPEGAPNCLAGLTFVISGTLDSLEREEAEDLIKRHGGRVTGSVSKKTNYLLCDEDIGGRKSAKAQELGTKFLTEDGLFDMIRASNKGKAAEKGESKKPLNGVAASPAKKSPQKVEVNRTQSLSSLAPLEIDGSLVPVEHQASKSSSQTVAPKAPIPRASPAKRKSGGTQEDCLPWTEKYRPKVPNDITGNQSLVKQLHDWLTHWNQQFLNTGSKEKGKKQNDSAKKAVLLSGTPGIGKTTSAKVVCKMLGYQAIEVNASDSRGKADAKIQKGVGGSTANSVKELVSNSSFSINTDRSKHPKSVLIMDEVDGMSAGDRGGVADLIATIKISKIPIICICNDRYSQKLKSLVNHCLLLNFRKPTKTQMAKRLQQIAVAEGLQANEIALEELSERANGDMRMAVNQLQYMSLSMSVIKYDDVRARLLSSAKDEDISPFTAVDKLFAFNSGKLRMDERIDLSMSDPDLVPLLIQENYLNYRPSSAGKDDSGMKRMNLIARAAESLADGDIINVQIRRYRQWQLSQTGTLASCIIPSVLLHGQREVLEQGERNFNRFGGWLGKNSTMGKNFRLMEDLHIHLLASRESGLGRTILRVDYLSSLLKRLTDPLRELPKDEAVEKVVEFMDSYSISQDDFDTIVELSKFQGRPNPLEGVPPAVKAALTKAYNKGSSSRVIRTADLINLPGIKKVPKKRVAAMLEPADDGLVEDNGDAVVEDGEENGSDTEDLGDGENGEGKLDLKSLNSKGIQVEMDVKGGAGKGSAKKSAASAGGRGRGKGAASEPASAEKKGGRGSGSGSGSATKRKR